MHDPGLVEAVRLHVRSITGAILNAGDIHAALYAAQKWHAEKAGEGKGPYRVVPKSAEMDEDDPPWYVEGPYVPSIAHKSEVEANWDAVCLNRAYLAGLAEGRAGR